MDNAPLALVRSLALNGLHFTPAHSFQAHVHARNAVFETQNANPKAALQEHQLAAGEFANARETTRDSEVHLASVKCDEADLRLTITTPPGPSDPDPPRRTPSPTSLYNQISSQNHAADYIRRRC